MTEFRNFRKIALVFSIIHFFLGLISIPLHENLLLFSNITSDVLGLTLEMIPIPSEKFWFAFSLSNFFSVSFSSFYSSLSPKNISAWASIIVSKFVSFFMMFLFFFTDVRAFIYIIGALLELSFLIISIYIWEKYKDVEA